MNKKKRRMKQIDKLWEKRGVEDASAEPEWEEYESILYALAEIEVAEAEDDFTVALMTANPFEEHCKPLAIGVTEAIAKSIRRWYHKHICEWSDWSQTGSYVMVVSRVYCTNHKDFEIKR